MSGMNRFVGCLAVAACGGVKNPASDAPLADAVHDAAGDGAAANCLADGFDGSVLDARWSVLAGASPTTYDVSGSRLFISDAPLAVTPSMPANSWIYDLDTDKGNQIAWPQAIGGEDFTLTAELGWSSTTAELTLGAVGVSDAQGTIAAMAGASDPSGGTNGRAFGSLHVANDADITGSNAAQEPGTARVKIQRRGGAGTISIDDKVLVTGTMPALISNVVIIYVRHKNTSATYDFGSFEVRQIEICRP